MHFGADMVRDETDDPFSVGRREMFAAIGQADIQAIDPQAAVGVEHDLDDGRIGEQVGDRRAQRGPQHAGTTGESL